MAAHGGVPGGSCIVPRRGLEHESRALLVSVLFLCVGLLIGGLTMWGGLWPLFGANSVGQVAAAVGSVSAILSFPAAYWPSITGENGRLPLHAPRLSRTKRIFDTVGLALGHGAIILLAILTLFTMMQSAFDGVKLDVLAGSICVGGSLLRFRPIFPISPGRTFPRIPWQRSLLSSSSAAESPACWRPATAAGSI